MGQRMTRAVISVKELLESFTTHPVEERVIRYIVSELHAGRSFDAVMGDPYVVNNTGESFRAQLLQNPSVLRSIEDRIANEFEDYSRQVDA